MYLESDAIGTFDRRTLRAFDWARTTVLMVAYDWNAVSGGAEAPAARRLARALLVAGARVHVLTASVAPVDDIRHSRYAVTAVPCEALATGRLRRALQMVRTMVPEATAPWVATAVPAGMRLLAALPDDTIIYSRSMPGTSNIVAWHLATRTRRPWVAHFSDTWPARPVLPASRKILAPYKWPLFAYWRHRILRDAGALTFTNPGQAAEMAGRWPSRYQRKSFVVTHLASRATPVRTAPHYDRFRIVHTGNLYSRDHTAATLLQGLKVFLDRTPGARDVVRFTQAGWANGDVAAWTDRCGLGDVVELVGRLSEEGVLSLLDRASVLVAIDYQWPDSTTLLSKLPDYVSARRPILAIAAPTSTLGRLCARDGLGVIADHDSPGDVADRIALVYTAWRQRNLEPYLPGPRAIAAFASRNVMTELAGAFTTARRAEPFHLANAVSARPEVGAVSGRVRA